MHARLRPLFALLLPALLGAPSAYTQDRVPMPRDAAAFEGYWSRGQAEITSYSLEQARYGEVHPGQAVLIFVTEDLSRAKQVKLDRPELAGDDRARVLKLNLTKKFDTGVYPYSMMSSIFTPLDGSGTLKLTTSVQEWCGHVFVQANRRADGWELEGRSYFESEGDQDLKLPLLEIEDDLWTRLRLNPASLPIGAFEMLPSSLYLRLAHRPFKAYAATAARKAAGADGIAAYVLQYPELGRTLTIRHREAFPFEIESWEEIYPDGRGGKMLVTRAVRKERLMLDYWSHNSLADAPLRARLGLE